MKIAIIGYGKMGKEIHAQCEKRNIPVSKIVDRNQNLLSLNFAPDEVAIEFTTPSACYENIKALIAHRVPTVCGTTGWQDHLSEVKNLVEQHQGSFLFSSNFSLGVHLFWYAVKQLSSKMTSYPEYNVSISETHHIHKMDAPSGTAKTTAELIKSSLPRIDSVEIESIRKGEVYGDHHVRFSSEQDLIEISHKASNRSGFAMGAIECAAWIQNKKGFFTIEHFLKEKL